MKDLKEGIVRQILNRPLPAWSIKDHPTKAGMSSINSIAVTDRLNEAFGINGWKIDTSIEQVKEISGTYKNGNAYSKTMIVAKVRITFADGSYKETYGGNDNADLGDAYKGAVTDGLTKIGSWLGIGGHVWKNDPKGASQDSNTGRGIGTLIMMCLKVGTEKQQKFLASVLSSSAYNRSRKGLIDKLNNGDVSVDDAIKAITDKSK